ncbi:MAG: hypothetical protein K2N58_05785 [Treponemataceae bacterium]|nr:hypothetical protein [Treponemataceae bacterium]
MKKFKKLAAVLAALVLALSCFVACSNGADTGDVGNQGGGSGGGGNTDEQKTPSLSDVANKSIAGYTTPETKTQAGNNVSDMLYLLEGGKFELYKNLSYGEYSGFALFAKGSYSGNILTDGKLTFKIEEEVNTASLTENEKTMLGLSSSSAKSARSALAARSELGDIISELKSLIKKLESIERKNVSDEEKSLKIKSDRDGITVTDADDQEQKITAGVSGVKIELEGFLLTGNPCLILKDEKFDWAGTKEDGAIPLKKLSDGKYTCTFIADDNDTLFKLMTEGWKSQYGLFSIDVEGSSLPSGVKITNDTEVVNVEHEERQNPENIAIAGLERRRKYDITFDTAKTPGKICIELKKHVITTLDGYMISGTMTTLPGKEMWPGSEEDGARPLVKSGDKWTCSLKLNDGWNGFYIVTYAWNDVIGWSQLAFKADAESFYGEFHNDAKYPFSKDEIAFTNYEFEGTEKATLTFTVRSDGLIDIDCDIE